MRSSPSPPGSFSASYDLTTKIISAVVCTVLLVGAAVSHSMLAGCIALAVVAVVYAYSPRGYTISEGSILVQRLIGDARLPLQGVREARAASRDDFKGCLRLWGNGGLFGYYGLFRTSKLGKCTWYVTNRAKTVVIVTEAKTALFSPDDVDGFLAAIWASAVVPDVPTTEQPVGGGWRSYSAGRRARMLISGAGGIVGIVCVVVSFFYSPGPPNYTLTSTALTIHDWLYPVTLNAHAVDVEHIRVVDFAVDKDWRPTLRTNGFATAHYHSGWFRVASGKRVRMYRADAHRLVLLPPKGNGAPVLLEVKEPEKFVEALRQEWSSHS